MDLKFEGRIIAVLPEKSGISKTTGNKWMMQEYVIEEMSGQYPKRMCFSIFGEERIKAMDVKVGREVRVSFDVDAKEWQGKWYNEIRAWKVEDIVVGTVAGVSNGVVMAVEKSASEGNGGDLFSEEGDGGLPF